MPVLFWPESLTIAARLATLPGTIAKGQQEVPLDVFLADELQEVTHDPTPDGRVAQRSVAVDLVAVVSALSAPSQVAGPLQIGEHAVRRPLRDLGRSGDLRYGRVGAAGDRKQHLRVVGDERPRPQRGQIGWNASVLHVPQTPAPTRQPLRAKVPRRPAVVKLSTLMRRVWLTAALSPLGSTICIEPSRTSASRRTRFGFARSTSLR
jgi:hypothetical protein